MKPVTIRQITLGPGHPLALIAGPCVIESESVIMQAAESLKKLTSDLGMPWIFKSSFDKANRSSVTSFRGPGLDEGLKILDKVKTTFDVPVLTDIHTPEQAAHVASVADVLPDSGFSSAGRPIS